MEDKQRRSGRQVRRRSPGEYRPAVEGGGREPARLIIIERKMLDKVESVCGAESGRNSETLNLFGVNPGSVRKMILEPLRTVSNGFEQFETPKANSLSRTVASLSASSALFYNN